MTTKSVFVKFRASEAHRSIFNEAAARRGTTSSALLRRFVVGLRNNAQPDFGASRADWAAVRQLANQVLTFADEAHQFTPDAVERVRIAAGSLHRMARQHLGPVE